MKHVHAWYVTNVVHLSLPTREGFTDRLTSWQCRRCDAFCDITGEVRHGFALETPEFWDRIVTEQARRETARLVRSTR